MIFETFKQYDITECDYESHTLTMTVGELLDSSHSSNIQRVRNEEKEKGIMKFIKKHIDNNSTPFFQPFILHHKGNVFYQDGKSFLNPQDNFETTIIDEDGNEMTKLFKFEVIDGNGRLNAMIRLQQFYLEKIIKLSKELEDEQISEKRAVRVKKQIQNFKDKNAKLKGTKITVQLYLNLNEESKKRLFTSVNQSEPMSRGRLEVYSDVKPENQLLHDYIIHTSNLEGFKYEITVDKDAVRTKDDRKHFIPSIYLIPVLKKIIKLNKDKDISEYKEDVFKILDTYIMNVKDCKMFRKQFFSILGSVITTSYEYEESVLHFVERMTTFSLSNEPDVSKELKSIRNKILNHVFNNYNKVNVTDNVINIDMIEEENLAQAEVAFTE